MTAVPAADSQFMAAVFEESGILPTDPGKAFFLARPHFIPYSVDGTDAAAQKRTPDLHSQMLIAAAKSACAPAM